MEPIFSEMRMWDLHWKYKIDSIKRSYILQGTCALKMDLNPTMQMAKNYTCNKTTIKPQGSCLAAPSGRSFLRMMNSKIPQFLNHVGT